MIFKKKQIGFNWKDHYAALDKRGDETTPCRVITGKNFHIWAEFSRRDGENLKQLIDALMIDLRNSRTLSFEEEKICYLAYDALQNTIKACETQEELDIVARRKEEEEKSSKPGFWGNKI